MPPLLEDVPSEYQREVFPLLSMDNEALEQEVNQIFPQDKWVEYDALLAKKKETRLTSTETKKLDILRHQADVVTFRKAYAAVLLKRKGKPVRKPTNHPLSA